VPNRVRADQFGWQLDQIRNYFEILTFKECMDYYLIKGSWPKNSVIITIDDGYHDFYEYAFPELVSRKLHATLFVTASFVDQKIWLWPDRLYYLLSNTTLGEIPFTIASGKRHLRLSNAREVDIAWRVINDWCISVPDIEKERLLLELESLLAVSIPSVPTRDYSALNWDELREVHSSGIEIGSHTMTHPILSKIDPDLLEKEILESKLIIESQLQDKVSTFCYPNSAPDDVNENVVNKVLQSGYIGAVFGGNLSEWEVFRVPRMGVGNDRSDFLWKLYGGESISGRHRYATK